MTEQRYRELAQKIAEMEKSKDEEKLTELFLKYLFLPDVDWDHVDDLVQEILKDG